MINGEYIYYIIFGITFFFSLVQDNIRPNYDGGNSLIIYFLGVIPNFLPGIGLPSFLCNHFRGIQTSFILLKKD